MKFRPGTIIAAALLIMTGLSSCVREYLCVCEISYSGQAGLPDTVMNEYPIKDTKSNAQAACQANSGEYNNNGIKATETCDLY